MPTLTGYYSTQEAAEELGRSGSAIRDAIIRGALRSVRAAGRTFIPAAELERYRREHLGRQGWEARKQPGYEPNQRQSSAQRAYRQRTKAARQQPAPERTPSHDPTTP